MADDPIETLAVGVAADHQAQKRKGGRKSAETVTGDGSGEALPPVEGEGASELRAAVARLGDAVDDAEDRGERAFELAVDRLMTIAEEATFDSGTLVGDIRDTLLDILRANHKPVGQLPEDQQRRIADAMETIAKGVVRKVLLIVKEDSDADSAIHAKLESYAEKGGLKINLTATGDTDTVIALHKAVGQQVIVMRADATRYNGERREAAIDPDQPDLQFEGGDDPDRSDDDLAGIGGDDDRDDQA